MNITVKVLHSRHHR